MSDPLSARALVRALKAEGVKVKKRLGWSRHNRNHKGPWGPVNGVMIHHTAGTDSLNLVRTGTPDLPGPLCHTHLAKSGTATMVGHGRANHAGTIAGNAHAAVLAEASRHPRPSIRETVDGNAHYYGIEIENLGDGEDRYPAVQYDAAVRWATAICRAHGWTAESVIGHKEGTRRKIDPSFSMSRFRADVAERLSHSAGWNPDDTSVEDDMPIRTSLGKNKSQSAPWGEWTSVYWGVEHADPEGQHAEGYHPGYVPESTSWADFNGRLRLAGMEPGDQLQVRYEIHEWRDGASAGDPWTEIIADLTATPGDQFVSVPFSKRLHEGEHVYVSVKPILGEGREGEGRESVPAPMVVDGRWAIRQDR